MIPSACLERHNTCELSSCCFNIAFTSIFSVCFGENAAKKKKKRSCPFSSSKKKSKSEFDKEWAAKLAESDKGSFYRQEKWLEELDIQKTENATVAESASRSKI